MRIREIIWGDWNLDHIVKHGGSVALAELVLNAPTVSVSITAARLAKARAVVVTKDWTVVFAFESISGDTFRAYPITMYPTKRGSRRSRSKS